MELKAVLFDMDGVLIDSESYYMQGTYAWMTEKGFQGTLEEIYVIIGTTLDETYRIEARLLNNRFTIDEIGNFNDDYFDVHPVPYKDIKKLGVDEILKTLKAKGIKIALCSSSPFENIQLVLQECNLGHYFDFVVSGEQFTKSKPHPEIYLHAAEVLQVKPSQCVVIEDSRAGVTAGHSANMTVIGIQDLKYNHDHTLATVSVLNMFEAQRWIDEKFSI